MNLLGSPETSDISALCPLTAAPGQRLRVRSGPELMQAYERHFGLKISPELAAAYFHQPFAEYESPKSGLRWFTPPVVGNSDFYEFLSSSLPWYYGGDTWDKRHALSTLRKLHCRSIFEAGCGSGDFLRRAKDLGITVAGSEINAVQLYAARDAGFAVYRPDVIPASLSSDALVMLQVLEHVPRPLEFARGLVQNIRPRYALIAVPAFETLLGRTTDPLVWPPHHISFWSAKGLKTLAELLGANLIQTIYQPLTWQGFVSIVRGEPGQRLPGLPSLQQRRVLKLCFLFARSLRLDWATRAHTVLGVLEFQR